LITAVTAGIASVLGAIALLITALRRSAASATTRGGSAATAEPDDSED